MLDSFSPAILLLVAIGGFLGAVGRYLLTFVTPGLDRSPGRATLWANALGSLLIGLWTGIGAGLGRPAEALLAIGFTGALSTFSTLMYETWRLLADGEGARAAASLLANLLWGGALLAVGLAVGGRLGGRP